MAGGKDFLGRGLAFPVTSDGSGSIAYAEAETDVEQSIRIVLGTAPGERVMRPQFGCGIHERVFDSIDTSTRSLIEEDVRDALLEWEPRIDVESVSATVSPDEAGKLLIEVDYRVRATNAADNLVYPFYLDGA